MPEHQNIEWKESWRDEYLKWICAFANSQGGTLIIGKRDDGSIKGVENSKKLLESLPNKISHTLGLICDVNLKTEGELEYIEITVEPSSSAVAYDGRYFKRTGSTTKLLTGNALSEFLRKKSNIEWDEEPIFHATINDIDLNSIESFKREAKKSGRIPSISDRTSVEDILRNLNLIDKKGNLKRGAIVLFGKEPHRFVSTAYVKIGKFGDSRTDLRSQEVVEGNNFELADKVIELLDYKYIIRDISYEGVRRRETPEYPFEAIREAIFNAIIHREYESTPIHISIYDDKLEIWNDGLLDEKLKVEDLKKDHQSHPRNVLMANVFYKAGLIETWGRGTLKIIESCKAQGLPEPQIHEYSGGVAVTLYKAKKANQLGNSQLGQKQLGEYINLSKDQKKVVDYISENGFITTESYSNLIKVTDRTARRHLNELINLGLIEKIGSNRSTKYILIEK